MPPKKKGPGKKPAKPKTPILIDGLTKEEMSKEQLEEHIVCLREELDREREERNYFQLERDKINDYREITDIKLEQLKAELENLNKDIEEDDGRHRVQIRVYRQKMKHLLCEHQNTLAELEAEHVVCTEVISKEQERLETKFQKKMKGILVDMAEFDDESFIKELEMKHEEEMDETRKNYEKECIEVVAQNKKSIELLRRELDNVRKSAASEMEHQWTSHISNLKEDHKKIFSEAKTFISAMKNDSKRSIELKTETSNIKKKQKKSLKELFWISEDNKRLTELILKASIKNTELEKKLKYNSERKDTSGIIKEKELKDLRRDCEVLEQKFNKLQQERDELKNTVIEHVGKEPYKADVEITPLEGKLQALIDSLEKTEAQINAVLSVSNMDQTAISGITNEIEENLASKNTAIKNLQYKINAISKAHRNLLIIRQTKVLSPLRPLKAESSNCRGRKVGGKSL
ncbi:dynein regulatory complex subunit 4 [Brachyistius frenatus]|uniref:dynein regulatory complex subunit 4 n=1 Tax=Brachyistius frenatus TaxID=100188 RepID=UPI0037E72CAD